MRLLAASFGGLVQDWQGLLASNHALTWPLETQSKKSGNPPMFAGSAGIHSRTVGLASAWMGVFLRLTHSTRILLYLTID